MAEKEQSIGSTLAGAIRATRQLGGVSDRPNLSDTLVKSSQWKKNTLHVIEVEQLRQAVEELEAENARLTMKFQGELEAQRDELQSIQEAYDQFEQQSDLLLSELDEQNERLRSESKYKNKRSLL